MSRARHADKPALGSEVSAARVRNWGVGPRKVRFVADMIRGLSVDKALAQLSAMHKPSGAPILFRAVSSALANANQAKDGGKFDAADLLVGEVYVDSGKILYRHLPMPMGRAGRIRKRSCHITVKLYEGL